MYVGIPTGSVLVHACVISGQLDKSSCAYISLWAGFQISVVIVVLLIIPYVKGDTIKHCFTHRNTYPGEAAEQFCSNHKNLSRA